MRRNKRCLQNAFILFGLFSCANPNAFAADEDFIPATTFGDGPQRIAIIRKEACLDLLSPIIEPEKTIVKGLAALQAGPTADDTDCVKDIVIDWPRYVPAPDKDPRLAELEGDYREAQMARNCLLPYPAESEDGKTWIAEKKAVCKGKFAEPAMREALNNRERAAGLALSEYRNTKQMENDLRVVATVLAPNPSTVVRDELHLKMACRNPSFLAPHCKGIALNNDEATKVSQELYEANQKIYKEEQGLYYRRQELALLIRYEGPGAAAFDRSALTALAMQLNCLSKDSYYPPNKLREFCQARGLPLEGDAEPIREKLRQLIPDPAALMEKWKAEQKIRDRSADEKKSRQLREEEKKYSLRRLLALHQAFAKRNPASSLEDFCVANEQQQAADRNYAAKTNKIQLFNYAAEWKWAAENGSTEAELSAIKYYTASYYGTINPRIWRSKAAIDPAPLKESDALYVETLNRSLGRADPYRGKPVRRFSELPAAVLAAHEEGKIVTYDSFTSTSKKEGWIWKGGASGNYHGFLIYGGKNGVDVESVSSNSGEAEVLFRAGTRFKVLSRKERRPGSNVFDFVMAEVDEAGDVIADLPKGGADGAK